MKLYELGAEYLALLEQIDPETGEITPEVEQALNDVQDSIEQKVESICKILATRKAEAAGIKAEEERLANKRRAVENGSDGLKKYLLHHMQGVGLEKVKTPLFSVGIQNASRPSLKWTGDPEKIPTDLVRVTYALDGNAAYLKWKEGTLDNSNIEVSTSQFLSIR